MKPASSLLFWCLAWRLLLACDCPLQRAMIHDFGLVHGYAHGNEMGESVDAVHYIGGFLVATALLHAGGFVVAAALVRKTRT